jgi:hypothetical protein
MLNESSVKRILGLAMILVGITCGLAQLAKGSASKNNFAQATAVVQPGASGMPRIENAKLEVRAISKTLDSAMRELSEKADKPEWIGYSVDQIAGDRGACCGNYNDDGNCGTCRLENDHNWTSGTAKTGDQTGRHLRRQLRGAHEARDQGCPVPLHHRPRDKARPVYRQGESWPARRRRVRTQ